MNAKPSQQSHQTEEFRGLMADPLVMLMASRGVPLGFELRVRMPDSTPYQPFPGMSSVGVPLDLDQWEQLRALERARQLPRPASPTPSSPPGLSGTPEAWARVAAAPNAAELARSVERRLSELVRAATRAHATACGGLERLAVSAAAQPDGRGSVEGDTWNATRATPEEIARRVAQMGGAGGNGDDEEDSDGGEEDDEEDALAAAAAVASRSGALNFQTVEQMGREFQEMDEIFEVLARVPWLNDKDVDEKELLGVITVGLLGTLEEVGWSIRGGLEHIWAGERDSEVVVEGLGVRERNALVCVLYHTQRFEASLGPAPAWRLPQQRGPAPAGHGTGPGSKAEGPATPQGEE